MLNTPEMQKKYSKLTKKQQQVFDYINTHTQDICYISLKELSKRAGVSEVSVLRLCAALGFEGFLSLKEAFRQHNHTLSAKILDSPIVFRKSDKIPLQSQIAVSDAFRQEHANLLETLNNISTEDLFACARALLGAREVFVFAHDASILMAEAVTYRLYYLRLTATAVKLGDDDRLHSMLARLTQDDVVIFFSFPVYHMPTAEVARFARFKGATVITITDSLDSPAVVEGSHNLLCKTSIPFFFNAQSIPMAVVEMLTTCIAVEMGDKVDQIRLDEEVVNKFFKGDEY